MAERSDQKPTIELYMYSLNQEFPAGKGHETYLKRHSELQKDITGSLILKAGAEAQVFKTERDAKLPADWAAQWLENRWIENHTKAAGVGTRQASDPLRGAIIREEDFGAILFEPTSDRVYKLNKAAALLVKALRESGQTAGQPKRISGFSTDIVDEFVSALRVAGLWGASK
ncbi:hypothetical protein WDM22_00635 [Bradyrhizobium septentrionale]|uniref:hypothetical protein n=1 Tax=Bradyrhizobium septentrionale TaxID=1404411 RepID=UPI0030D47DB0